MKIAATIARLLLGLIFTVFGLNGFLHFLKQPPPTGLAAQYLGSIAQGHWFPIIFGIQLVTGLMLLAGYFVPLALVLLGPILGNILLFHVTMAPSGLPPGLLAFVLWLIVFFYYRENFAGIFRARGLGSDDRLPGRA